LIGIQGEWTPDIISSMRQQTTNDENELKRLSGWLVDFTGDLSVLCEQLGDDID
jgi:hypothetical protein